MHPGCADRLPFLATDMVALVYACAYRVDSLLHSAARSAPKWFAPLGGTGPIYVSAFRGRPWHHGFAGSNRLCYDVRGRRKPDMAWHPLIHWSGRHCPCRHANVRTNESAFGLSSSAKF